MKKKLLCTSVLALLAIGLAGCGNSSNSSSSTTTTTTTTAAPLFEDSFGTQFGILYRTAANTNPANVNDTDVVPVTLTVDPVAVPY